MENFGNFLKNAGIVATAAVTLNGAESAPGTTPNPSDLAQKDRTTIAVDTKSEIANPETTFRMGVDSLDNQNSAAVHIDTVPADSVGDSTTIDHKYEPINNLELPKPHFLNPEFEAHVDGIDSLIDEIENDSTILEIQDYVTNHLTDPLDRTIDQMIEKSYKNYVQSHPAGVSVEDFANALIYTSLQKIDSCVNQHLAVSNITYALSRFADRDESIKKLNVVFGAFLLFESGKFSPEKLSPELDKSFRDDLATYAKPAYEYFYGVGKQINIASEIFEFSAEDFANEGFLNAASFNEVVQDSATTNQSLGFVHGYLNAIKTKTTKDLSLRKKHVDNLKSIITTYERLLNLYTGTGKQYDVFMPLDTESSLTAAADDLLK